MHLCVCLCECLYEYRIPKRNHLADVGMIMMQTGMVNQGITSVMNTMEGTLSKPFPKTKQKKKIIKKLIICDLRRSIPKILIPVYIYTQPKDLFVAANPNLIENLKSRSDSQSNL